jgi:hypothetical protein
MMSGHTTQFKIACSNVRGLAHGHEWTASVCMAEWLNESRIQRKCTRVSGQQGDVSFDFILATYMHRHAVMHSTQSPLHEPFVHDAVLDNKSFAWRSLSD